MTFSQRIADIIAKPGEITTLLSIRPRIRITDWTNMSVMGQNVWRCPWTRGNVVAVSDVGFYPESVNGMPYYQLEEEATYAAMAADKGTWFFDEENQLLYANFNDLPGFPSFDSTFPNNRFTWVDWEMFYATKQLNWYRNPQSALSDDQVWTGGLVKPPIPQQGNPDLLFGFSPVRVTDVQIAVGDDSEVLGLLHDWSVNGSIVQIWECVGQLSTDGMSQVFTGLAGSYALSKGNLSIQLTDPLNAIDQEMDEAFFDDITFGGLDPQKQNAPLRRVLGAVQGFIPVNIDFDETPDVDVNRDHVVCQGEMADAPVLDTVIDETDPDTTNSSSKVADASGFRSGDSIIVEEGGTPHYGIFVFSVDYDTNVIQHSFMAARVAVTGDRIYRGFVGSATLDDGNGNAFNLAYGRDWTESDFAGDTRGIVLADNFEANIPGCPSPYDPSQHTIYLTVYGEKIVPLKLDGITPFCSLAKNGGALANPVGLLWHILRTELRTFRELVSFDEATWYALAQTMERTVGTAIPEESGGSWGSWKEIIQEILQSELLRLHIRIQNGLATLTITRDGPTGTPDVEAGQQDLSNPSWSWDYSDCYHTSAVSWGHQEFSSAFFYGGQQNRYATLNNPAKYFHRLDKTLEIKTLHYESDDAFAIVQQFNAILGERRGILNGLLPPSFMETHIGDVVNYSTKFLPGAVVSGEMNERPYKLTQHAKSPQGITVTLEDQKGVEEFTGDWEP